MRRHAPHGMEAQAAFMLGLHLAWVAPSLADTLAQHPKCGILAPSQVHDTDSFCIHLVHNATRLGELRLINSTADGTFATRMPPTIAPGESGWWALRDSVKWKRSGYYESKDLFTPYTFTATYRAPCVGECHADEPKHYDVVLTLALRDLASAAVKAQHVLTVNVHSSGELQGVVGAHSEFMHCALVGTATLRDEGGSLAPPSATRRTFHPADSHPDSWCWYDSAWREAVFLLGQASGTGGTDQIDLSQEDNSCGQMATARAVNAVHIRYFLMQQQAERDLIEGAEHCLCGATGRGGGGDAEAEYQSRLELLNLT